MRKMRKSPSAHSSVSYVRKLHSNSLADMSHLTHIRSLTHTRQTRVFLPLKTARASSQSGARFFSYTPNIYQDLKYLDAKGVERLRQSLPSLTPEQMKEICKERKKRREVIFAKGASGGNHRPPTYNFKSLVRC